MKTSESTTTRRSHRPVTARVSHVAQCIASKKRNGREYGWYRDPDGTDHVEEINSAAEREYLFRTDTV